MKSFKTFRESADPVHDLQQTFHAALSAKSFNTDYHNYDDLEHFHIFRTNTPIPFRDMHKLLNDHGYHQLDGYQPHFYANKVTESIVSMRNQKNDFCDYDDIRRNNLVSGLNVRHFKNSNYFQASSS